MKREDFNYPSADKITEIHGVRWIPEGEIKAILQISHGMVEHIDRYEDFASFMTEHGVLVTGNDHLGHGKSVSSPEELGDFPNGGNRALLQDIHNLRKMNQEKYPEIPYLMLGHSMGSFLLRQYICLQGIGLWGAIIMGTGNAGKFTLKIVRHFSALFESCMKKPVRSKFFTRLSFGGYNKRIPNATSKNAWLSRDEDQVKKYDEDPLCGYMFTYQGFFELYNMMLYLKYPHHLQGMPRDLACFFVSGSEDPVGNYGKEVEKTVGEFKELGMQDVSMKLYDGARHELLNELNKDEVYQDILDWVIKQI